jgi:hypothetical protein
MADMSAKPPIKHPTCTGGYEGVANANGRGCVAADGLAKCDKEWINRWPKRALKMPVCQKVLRDLNIVRFVQNQLNRGADSDDQKLQTQ